MIQQNRYNDGYRYIKWINKNYKKNFITIELLFILLFILSIIINNKIIIYMHTFIYIIISYIIYKIIKKEQVKKKLVFTKRIQRLLITTLILFIIPSFIIFKNFNINNVGYYYLILDLMVYLIHYIEILANFINKPIEKLVYLYYFNKARTKLKSMSNLDVIGITGSYGKTSSKNIIYDILNVKYNVFQTPLNYNTPYGLCNTVNNYLDKFSNFFVAEMGALKVGEIKSCCDVVKPKYGIITKIGKAHLESFGSIDNILKTKFELIESLPSDGIGILNGDDKLQLKYKIKNKCKILYIGIDNHDVDLYATNIKLTNKGTTFDCKFKNDKKLYTFQTSLLGYNNIYNLLTGILLGHELGIDIDKLIYAVKMVKPVEHRLELKQNNGLYIIDDAYNSNPIGSKMALEVLGMMDGVKIVVTPGMIELGSEQYKENYEFGKVMAKHTDYAILVGEVQTKPIYEGLIKEKFNKDNIYVINDVKKAFPIINKLKKDDTYVLLENDLPDVFNEE